MSYPHSQGPISVEGIHSISSFGVLALGAWLLCGDVSSSKEEGSPHNTFLIPKVLQVECATSLPA